MRTLITTAVTACAGVALLAACGSAPESSAGAPTPSNAAITPSTGASTPAATGTSTSGTAPSTQGAEKDAGACTSAELAVTLGPSQGQNGMQKADTTFTLTNKGTRSCTLDGFPGVSFVTGDNGTQVGEPARRNEAPTQLVTLAPGAGAATFLLVTNAGAYSEAECAPVDVRGLRIYPPGETAALFLEDATRTCSTAPQGSSLLTVGPVGVLP
ncbi:DUF4232 domain-containing protein [Umezawaea endophytica]|uniref:DUF4232 domain-containing protein n=1 Tax=Umezawaea endophytica TaxID=1654476 RepID=A0A9X2VS28_9PSEU|nr:DUF4232 domain-containing protein [Umezawaea endophytica]MCS7480518.1 DUF4232 domain-containing protein [Umezawaea endophytica]